MPKRDVSFRKTARVEPSSLIFQKLCEPQIECMHGVPSDEALKRGFGDRAEVRSVGKTWFIDPREGEGSYWYCDLGNHVVVASMRVHFFKPQHFDCSTVDFFCFGLYEQNMPAYIPGHSPNQTRVLVGYHWDTVSYHQDVRPGESLRATSVTILPEALPFYADLLGCCPLDIARAIACLDRKKDIYGLSSSLRELSLARLKKQTARAFYQAKVIECLALLLDGLEKIDASYNHIAAEDADMVALVCAHVEMHLDEPLTTRVLSNIAHASQGKLISAFKVIKGMAPQEYVRGQRMDHAQTLLRDESISIKEVALRVGYINQGGFCDAFKAAFGVTPRVFRKRFTQSA